MHQKNYGTGSFFNTSKRYILKLEEAFRVDKSLVNFIKQEGPYSLSWFFFESVFRLIKARTVISSC
jgi:hypothetical protein